MDVERFVRNVKRACAANGTTPTVACEESGAGKSLLSRLDKHGTMPSIEKVQLLAQYLGCTVSELLGEQSGESPGLSADEEEWLALYRSTAPEHRPALLVSVKALLNARPL